MLLAFYESPLSPLPVPPLPHPPVGRFPPEHSVWPANRIHRASNAPASNVARPSMANLQYPPINFAQHPSQFVSNPTQYHFAGSHLNPTLVEHPAQRNPSSASSNGNNSNAQRRASSNANASIQGRHQFAAPTQSSTLDSSNNSKGSSPQAASLQPASTSSESSHMIPVSGHKLSDSMQANPSLSPLNLLNLVNANHLLRRSEDTSSDTKQQQLVQAQLNQVQFGSSADLTHSDSQLNRS